MQLTRLTTTTDGGVGQEPPHPEREITALTADSRQVVPGTLFAALPGSRADGSAFIADALARGAAAILAPRGTRLPAGRDGAVLPAGQGGAVLPAGRDGAVLIEDDNPRRRFALMAAAFHGRPPRVAVAVTGTNGKTSTVQFARQLWARLGRPAACLGTLGLNAPFAVPAATTGVSMTTPDPVALHATLAALAAGGVEHVAMEASSHGLDQHRLDGVRLAAAAFTNLTRDHLDYHGTMAAYFAAKAQLFERVLPLGGTAVLNADAPEFRAFAVAAGRRGHRVFGYGTTGLEVRLLGVEPLAHGQRLRLSVLRRDFSVTLGLVGRFQVANALAALGLVLGAEAAIEGDEALVGLIAPATQALETLEGVPGRMQSVGAHPNGAPVIVDYAHSPDALETVLQALRPHCPGRLVVVFGCGGDRDRGKRPVMGGIASRLADRVIVTDDNPRSEVPAAIRQDILTGCPRAEEIGDRAEAIRTAVRGLAAGDLLVIAGKGHEQGQCVGAEIRPFDDAAEARAAVAECAG